MSKEKLEEKEPNIRIGFVKKRTIIKESKDKKDKKKELNLKEGNSNEFNSNFVRKKLLTVDDSRSHTLSHY